ncbi:MAG TPA: NAD-dependent epimerase/dehydratase family protein [Acidimicrobiales bacterium]|nr:NAD-dependent epimerase/dehydratase family protein [Acidimicrobiales bacterium]
MRVVVVGATGNIGTSLVEALGSEEQVSSILGICRRPPHERPPKTTFVAADVATSELTHHFRGADAVVHLAWLFQPTHSPQLTWKANAVGSIRVFAAAAEAGVSALVYSSSVGAYSPGGVDQYVDESWPTHSVPTAAYGREKAYVERALDTFEARHPNIRVVRLRPGFIFKRSAASEQRRLFAGPLLPGFLARPGRLPLLPHPPGLRFQALHSADAAEAFRLALVNDVRGAFNIAADPVIDAAALAEVFGARRLPVPRPLVRAAVATAWHLHLVPADPTLLDLVLQLPLLDTTRAQKELGWKPRFSGVEALREMLEGMADGAGGPTPTLAPDSSAGRVREVASGVGEAARP